MKSEVSGFFDYSFNRNIDEDTVITHKTRQRILLTINLFKGVALTN